jgi:hypothetical protein
MIKQLKNQLKEMGITKAIETTGQSEGYPAVFLRWGKDTEVFTGADPLDPDDPMARRADRFRDDRLS